MKRLTPLIILVPLILLLLSGCANNVVYSGDMENDLPHGEGELIHPNGTVYKGSFVEGRLCGEGTWEHPDGMTYRGQWLQGRYHGEGTLIVPNTYTYEGQWKEGLRHGYGVQTWTDGRRYEGDWKEGFRHGSGTMYYPDGSIYEGQWVENQREGHGTFFDPEGEEQTGYWEKDELVYIPVESVVLSATELALMTNDEAYQLIAAVFPPEATDQEIRWESADPEVASVEAGLVTPLAPGETLITATAAGEGIEAACQVTVTRPPVAVTGVRLDRLWLNLNLEDDPVTLTATVEPADATNKWVTWRSSNPEVATVDQNGRVTPLSVGGTEITVVTSDGGYSAICYVTVRVGIGFN